jgi:hypothetical protein
MRAIQDTEPKRANNPQSNCSRSTVASRITVRRTRFHRVGSGRGVFEIAIVGDAVRFWELNVVLRLLAPATLPPRVLAWLPSPDEMLRCTPTGAVWLLLLLLVRLL